MKKIYTHGKNGGKIQKSKFTNCDFAPKFEDLTSTIMSSEKTLLLIQTVSKMGGDK